MTTTPTPAPSPDACREAFTEELRVGRLPTVNQEEYPGLGDTWVQLRCGDEVVARVYGNGPQQAMERAEVVAKALNTRQLPAATPAKAQKLGNLATHVASALGALKGYGHGDTAAAKSLEHVQDELMTMYNASQLPAAEREALVREAAIVFRRERKFRFGAESEGDADCRAMRAALKFIEQKMGA